MGQTIASAALTVLSRGLLLAVALEVAAFAFVQFRLLRSQAARLR